MAAAFGWSRESRVAERLIRLSAAQLPGLFEGLDWRLEDDRRIRQPNSGAKSKWRSPLRPLSRLIE